MSKEHTFTHQNLDNNHVSMQALGTFIILLAMSPVLLVLVVVSVTYVISAIFAISGILGYISEFAFLRLVDLGSKSG